MHAVLKKCYNTMYWDDVFGNRTLHNFFRIARKDTIMEKERLALAKFKTK